MPISPERILVVSGPSTHGRAVHEGVHKPLEREGLGYTSLATPSPDFDVNVECIKEYIVDEQIVIAAGGDGIANLVANSVGEAAWDGREGVDTLFLPYGRASDIARSLNAGKLLRGENFLKILENGEKRALETMGVTIEPSSDEAPIHRLAVAYIGVGATAEATRVIGLPEARATRPHGAIRGWLSDQKHILGVARKHKEFTFVENGMVIDGHEAILAWREVDRLAGNRLQTDPAGRVMSTAIEDENLLLAFGRRMAREVPFGGLRGEPSTGELAVTIIGRPEPTDAEEVASPVHAHIDGELVKLSPYTTVRISDDSPALSVLVGRQKATT